MMMAIPVLPGLLGSATFRSTAGWALAHMQILGWGTMLAMGASYQLIQVILNTRMYSIKLGWAHYVLYTVGLVFLVHGFQTGQIRELMLGGSGVSAGVILYVLQMAVALIRKRIWNVFVLGMAGSMLHLLLTVGLGCCLGLGMAKGWFSQSYPLLFAAHMWLGLGGWLTGMIFTFSFKLLPMFYISAQKPGRLAYLTLIALFAGIWVQIAGLWSNLSIFGFLSLLCMSISIASMSIFVHKTRLTSRSKQPIGPVAVASGLIPLLIVVLLLLLGSPFFVPQANQEGNQASLILFLIMGWFTPTILAYLSRIVPFLWWAYRFRTKEEKKSAVLLHEMLPNKRMLLELRVYVCSIVCMVGGIWMQASFFAELGFAGSWMAAGLYVYELSRVFRY